MVPLKSVEVSRGQKTKEGTNHLNNIQILAPSETVDFLGDLQTARKIWAFSEVGRGQRRSKQLKEYHQLSILKILSPSANCRFVMIFTKYYTRSLHNANSLCVKFN